MSEAVRQRALLDAIGATSNARPGLALREVGPRAARGLAAYRANAEALADRALGAAFPTVRAMLGADDFARLARELWRAHPPQRGDVGEWGDALAASLEAHPALAAWPYLGDAARLDLAMHRNERAADAVLDAGSLGLLESTDPAQLVLRLMPGTALLRSRWPIGAVHAAHQLEGAAAERAFEAVRAALAERRGESVLVARRGWRAVLHGLDAPAAAFTEQVLAGATLAAALDHAGADFDFTPWLGTSLREAWLQRCEAAC